MAEKLQRNLRLNATAADLFDKAVGDGSPSEYIEHIVVERSRQWTRALVALRDAGWRPAEILTACKALNGVELSPVHPGKRIAWALESSGAASSKSWAERIKEVASTETVALALLFLANEFWTGNDACQRAVGAKDAKK
jgi:hypothetical protein